MIKVCFFSFLATKETQLTEIKQTNGLNCGDKMNFVLNMQ